MKKTRLLLLALAAFAFSAHAAPWFDAEISGYESWPTNPPAGTWSGTGGAALDAANHVLQINAPEGTTVAFAPVSAKDAADGQVVFASTNTLSAVQPIANLRPLEADKKGSLAAATDGTATNYYGWAKDPAGTTNTWLALTGAAPAVGTPFSASILAKVENGGLYVQYEVDGVTLASGVETWLPVVAANTTLAHAGMRGGNLEVAALYAFAEETQPPPTETVVLALAALPENVSLVSVTTNNIGITAVEGVYTVYSNATATVTFAPAEGYRLVGSATVDIAMDGNKTLATADMPTAELIPPPPPPVTATLTVPSPLPEGVTLVSVTTNGVAVAGEGAYTVYSNATVVATFAAAEGYVLSGDATVSVVVDGDKTLAGIPMAVAIANTIKINEIMASNPSVDKGGLTNALGIAEMDWIEIYNGTSAEVDLTGWYLSDNDKKGKEDKATILGSCVIPAGGYKIVWLDKIHTNATEFAEGEAFAVLKLSSSGDLIQLADTSKNVVDKINFKTKKQIKGYSYGPLSVRVGTDLVPGNGDPVYMKTATPGAPNVDEGWGDFTPAVTFSEPHGWKTEPFELTLSCADPNAAIYYTLDGTSPTTASILYTNAIPITKTTIVRAAVPDPTSVLQFDTSATYLYLDEVLAQERSTTAPAGTVGFPNNSSKQAMLYGMLQLTGEDRERMLVGFTNAIPTISVVTDPGNLFNSSTGIYVNAKGEGVEWERQIMLEQFDPTGVGADFSQPAGIRIRGGNSRQPGWAKHAIRFFFRSSYGESSLAQKMFPGELPKEAGEYDKLDLRCSQNFSWANAKSTMDTFVTEVFARDSQRDMGQPYTRSRYCHLFLNGQYWGLYQTQERGDEHWGESYLGGDSLQYDVIKAASSWSTGRLGYTIECNEGTWDAWSNLWEIATTQGFGGDYTNNYYRILGLNPDGTRNPNYPILLNAASLRAFMFSTHFMVDKDGPTSPYSGIDVGHANNFNAVRNRDDAGDVNGFVFLRHDAEVSMAMEDKVKADKNPTFWGTDAPDAPTVGSPDPSGLGKLKFRTIPYFTPAELHYLLMQNPVYAREYADAFYEFFLKEGGAMTVEKSTARYASRMAEIDDAIVCEQARWAQSGQTRTTWLRACNTATNFIKDRLGYMKSQYQSAGWYPSIEPPAIGDATGAAYEDDVVPYGELVYITTAVAGGAIYYTTNGIADPMDDGVLYTGCFPIPDTGFTVRARVFKDNEWSALEEVALEADVPNDQRYGIRIAAILNAAKNDPADEFIVLTNILDRAVDLEKLSIWSEKANKPLTKLAEYTESTNIPAGGTVRLAQPTDWIGDAKLKNGGIYVELHDFNGKRIQNAYVDSEGWFQAVPGDKNSAACNKTGRWFVALEFLGDTEKGEVTQEAQWTVSPLMHTVTFTWHGGSDSREYSDGTAAADVAVPADPPSYVENGVNHVFAGWSAAVPATITEDVAIEALYDESAAGIATVFTVDAGGTTNVIGTYETLAAAIAAAPAGSTVLLLADDSASFTADNLEIGISKAITIDGDGHTLYGLDDYAGGRGDHDIYVSGSADVTIRNITLADFGGAVPVTGRTYPIWTGGAYAGTLTLDSVTVTNFNRTAFNLNGGTVVVTNCTIAGDMAKGFAGGVFQEGIGVYNAAVTVEDTTITGAGSTYEKEDSQIAAAIQLGNPNGPVPGTGSITVRSGTFSGEYGIIVASNALNDVTVQGGAFTGALLAEEGEGGSIAVSGGTFDAPVPAEFAADGYAPTTIADNDGRYTVRTARTVSFTVDGAAYTNLVVADGEPVAQPADPVSDAYVFTGWTLNGAAYEFSTPVTEDIELEAAITSLAAAIWIAGAQGDWETAANWDIGYVPTKATIVTFTNGAQVAISDTDACKEMVLSNATATLVRHASATQPILRFYSDEGRAVSVASGATGSLAVNGIHLFNERTDSATLTIGCGLEILGDVTFRGVNPGNNVSASFAIAGKTTISTNALVKTIDYGTTKFQGGIEVAKGVTAKIGTKPHGTAQIGTGVTLVANDGEGAATAIWLMQKEGTSRGVSLVGNASIAVDADHAGLCYVKKSSDKEDYVPCDIYEVYRKPTIVTVAATEGLTVTGVASNQHCVPGTNLVIGVSGLAEGCEPSVTITKHEDSFPLLTTNAVSFVYTMPDFDIDISVVAVQHFYDPEGIEILDDAVIGWLSTNRFTQAAIDALGHDAEATDKFYECWLFNLDFRVQDADASLCFTDIGVSNKVSMTVQLVRKAPLAGRINGALYIYGADNLAAGFGRSPIPDESVEYFTGDPTFNLATSTDDTVTQTAVATLNDSVTAKFFKATIEVPWVDNGEDFEPEEP